jgi:uncharacterized membrane protein YeaQ/YmgE (transglycosylase-associated protein family)
MKIVQDRERLCYACAPKHQQLGGDSEMDAATTGAEAAGAGLGLILFLIIAILLSGLITGALARWLLPGPDPMSWPKTIGYGVAGSFVGGILWQIVNKMISLPQATTFLFSVGGAALLIWFFRRRKA